MRLSPIPATDDNIRAAGQQLRSGRLVAFPTETVYGLGADARNDRAVAQIFSAKGRPAFNPLIVHVAEIETVQDLAVVTPLAERLGGRFWPGGLTLVLEQRPSNGISDLVAAGLTSIAIRVPSHPVALKLCQACNCPIAAPSANRSGHISPTTPAHVAADLGNEPALAAILDDGPCLLGIESTILDLRGGTPRLLRHGAITSEALAEVGAMPIDAGATCKDETTAPRIAPGQLESHYAPVKPVMLNVRSAAPDQALLAFGAAANHSGPKINLSSSGDLIEAAAKLFGALRELDGTDAPSIAVMPIPESGLGRAINDRLRRAAAPRPTNQKTAPT